TAEFHPKKHFLRMDPRVSPVELDVRSVISEAAAVDHKLAVTAVPCRIDIARCAGKVIHDVAAPAETASEGIIRLKVLIHNQASVISALFGRRYSRIIVQDSNKTRVFHQ